MKKLFYSAIAALLSFGINAQGSQAVAFQHGVYENFPLSGAFQSRVDQIAACGFKYILNYKSLARQDYSKTHLTAYANYINSKGLKIIWSVKALEQSSADGTTGFQTSMPTLWNELGATSNNDFTTKLILFFKTFPATWGYYVLDEQGDPTAILNLKNLVTAADASHPTLSLPPCHVVGGYTKYKNTGTVVASDPYPIGRTMTLAGDSAWETPYINKLCDTAKACGQTIVPICQAINMLATYSWSFTNSHWPSLNEMKCEISRWRTVANAKGVTIEFMMWYSYFDIFSNSAFNFQWNSVCPIPASTTGLNESETQITSATIFPNPFNSSFIIKIPEHTVLNNAVMRIYDLCGKEVKTVPISDNEIRVNRDELKDGIYFYTLFNDGQKKESGKLVAN